MDNDKKSIFPSILFDSIKQYGHEARIVGGAVRNFLISKIHPETAVDIVDIDVASTALPSEIIEIFQKRGLTVIPVGQEYGTVIVVLDGRSYEITTLREDIKTFGRKAEVSFTKSFEKDSCRRDFTMNAIYMDENGTLFDYHNGIRDIIDKNVRFIGNPKARIMEDYLRILRYFRFVAYYGQFKCNHKYLSIMSSMKKNITLLSSERILSELLKILALDDAYRIVPQMRFVLDELFNLQCDPLKICHRLNIKNMSPTDKLCMMLKFSNIPANCLTKKYNFPRAIKQILLTEDIDSYDAGVIKKKLKTINKEHRFFFTKYFVVRSYFLKLISIGEAKDLELELTRFCNSRYADFSFKANRLASYNLSNEELKNVMTATKKFWLTSDSDISADDCLRFALDIIQQT